LHSLHAFFPPARGESPLDEVGIEESMADVLHLTVFAEFGALPRRKGYNRTSNSLVRKVGPVRPRSFNLLLPLLVAASTARGDVYQWQWVDPNDHTLGKMRSAVLCPDGAGVVATAYSQWPYLDLSQAYLKYGDLPNSLLYQSVLSAGYFENASLAGSVIWGCQVSNADFTSISAARANFRFSTLNGANFANADLSGATFLVGSMTGVSFQRANLTNAFFNTDLTGVDFTDAIIAGADLRHQVGSAGSGFTSNQLYSTASHKSKDLRRIRMGFNDLTGWNFSGIDLTEATFFDAKLAGAQFNNATLTGGALHGADLTKADLTDARLNNTDFGSAKLTNADLSRANFSSADMFAAALALSECKDADFSGANLESADLRGARHMMADSARTAGAIFPDGTVDGLRGFPFIIRNFDGDEPIRIRVTGAMRPLGINMHLDAGPWGSTIGFEPGIPVVFSGSGLQLAFEDDVDVSAQIGRTFQLFDWTDVAPTGTLQVNSAYTWDTSRLYSDGTVTLVPEPAWAGVGMVLAALMRFAAARRVGPELERRRRNAGLRPGLVASN
jgi:uncharacterized protein YjbI with pentapeptide repeats